VRNGEKTSPCAHPLQGMIVVDFTAPQPSASAVIFALSTDTLGSNSVSFTKMIEGTSCLFLAK
ncbi:MAG: hypothetical protein ACREQ3_12650, partial [Candidatus Binatia bacterium]